MFGDRIHLRVRKGVKKKDLSKLRKSIRKAGGDIIELRSIPPSMEDVFIAFVQMESKATTFQAKI
jgi:hypothetical protein